MYTEIMQPLLRFLAFSGILMFCFLYFSVLFLHMPLQLLVISIVWVRTGLSFSISLHIYIRVKK